MMIPPFVRTGSLPLPEPFGDRNVYAVLTRDGWTIAIWRQDGAALVNLDARKQGTPEQYFSPSEVRCWLPSDGS